MKNWKTPIMKKPIIVLVEDEVLIRKGLALPLRTEYHVIEAGHGADALEAILSHHDEILAVITDVRMPVMTGWELIQHLDEYQVDCLQIVTSATFDESDEVIRQQYPHIVMQPKPLHVVWITQMIEAYQAR
jgi:CheY-like chemotaxis protein